MPFDLCTCRSPVSLCQLEQAPNTRAANRAVRRDLKLDREQNGGPIMTYVGHNGDGLMVLNDHELVMIDHREE